MLVAYLLLFLLHLSAASTCNATSRNLFLPGAGDFPSPSPATLHHRHAAKDLSYYDNVHYHPAVMARRGGPPPLPSPGAGASGVVEGAPPPSLLAGVEASGVEVAPPPSLPAGVDASGVGGGAPPPPEEASAKMEPSPPPRQVDGGGGVGGTSSSEATTTEDQEESAREDVGVDYEGPKTHPPSHN